MDTKTPPIPLKHQDRKEPQRKQDRSPEPVSLPPLTPVPKSNRHQHQQQQTRSNNGTNAPWTRGPAYAARNPEHQRRRPYRVLHIGATPLMHACQQADRSRVLRLIKEQEETIGYRDRTLRSALHYCMDAGTGGAVASAAPELVNAPDAEGHTPLHLAVIAGDTQLVAVLLANGADVNAKDLEGHSVLHWATVCGEAECVRLVLAAGARPSTPDLRGGSPLHYAAQCCGAAVTAELSVPKKVGLKVLQTLLEFGADVNAKDEDGRQPILWAASAGSVEAVLALARAGGSAAAGATDKDGLTALHCAASRGHARCVEALVNLCGSHPDHVDDNGCSALHYAATLGHADATALLLRLGADPNRQDRKGRTPALCAAAKGQLETLKILAQHGGSLHARTVRGTGVAHEAVISGRIELIEWLAKKRPSTLDVATHDGKTPLHVAALHGYLDVCKVLLDNGARINAVLRTSKSGPMTALDAALYRGHRDCAKLVQMHGGTTAQHLRTHKTAPNRVFAAKLRVKRGDSSTDSESGSSRRGRGVRCRGDTYFEERWIERRTRRRAGSPRRSKDRRGSRSFSEEEIRLGKSSRRRERGRRARSESARYEGASGVARSSRRIGARRAEADGGRHEYGGSSSETNGESVDEETEPEEASREEKRSGRADRSSEDCRPEAKEKVAEEPEVSDEDERCLSEDSLEVVVVKKSLEKTSEKVQITGGKSKTPRETSRETRVTETRRSRKKSKAGRSSSRAEDTEDRDGEVVKGRRKPRKATGSDGARQRSEQAERGARPEVCRKEAFDEKMKDQSQFRRDVTDSTSQETVERVTVTAIVHKDQPPDTPKASSDYSRESMAAGSKGGSKESSDGRDVVETRAAKSEMDEILEKADELQNALLTRAADLRKDVEEIRRQATSGSSQDESHPAAARAGRDSGLEAEEASDGSDEPVTVKGRRTGETESESTSEDSQREFSRLQSRGGSKETSPMAASEGGKVSEAVDGNVANESSRSSLGEAGAAVGKEEKEDRSSSVEDKSKRTTEATSGSEEKSKRTTEATSGSEEKSKRTTEATSGSEEKSKRTTEATSGSEEKSKRTTEATSGSEEIRSRPSTAKEKTSGGSEASSSVEKKGAKETTEATSGSEETRSRPSSAKEKTSRSGESSSSVAEGKDTGENSADRSGSRAGEEKSEAVSGGESAEETSRASRRGSREKAFEELPDDEEGRVEATREKSSGAEEKGSSEGSKSGTSPVEARKSEEETPGRDGESGLSTSGKMRFIDGSSSGSAKSSRVESRSRPSTGRNGRGDSGRSTSKSPSKRSLFESSEERSPDRSAIVAVIESPEWDEEDDEQIEKEIRDAVGDAGEEGESEPEDEDGLGVLRVLPSTSEEETPRVTGKLLRAPKTTDSLPRVERRLGARHEGAASPQGLRGVRPGRAKQRRDSGGRDSGIEPSPRVSKIPKRTVKYCPNTEKQQALNMETVTRDVQISLRRYHLERKIFFQLMELKRLQIRHGRANEHVLVKRQVESFHKAGMSGPTLGVAKYDQPLTFRHFEAFLYEQLRRLQRRPATPDFCTEAKQCTQKTHRCHHATSAYTSVPVYTYLGGGGQEREEGLLPRIESRARGQMTVELTRGEEKQVIALPTEKLNRTKRYFVTFTVRGDGPDNEAASGGIKPARNNAQRNTKSV